MRIFRKEELDNINQETMAESLGIKQGSYSDIERGKSGVTGILTKLIMKYRINPIWLLEGIGLRRMNEATLMLLCTEIIEAQAKVKDTETESIIKLYEIIDTIEKGGFEEMDKSILSSLKREISALVFTNAGLKSEIENLARQSKIHEDRYLNFMKMMKKL